MIQPFNYSPRAFMSRTQFSLISEFFDNDQLFQIIEIAFQEYKNNTKDLERYFGKNEKELYRILECASSKIQYIQFYQPSDVPKIPNSTKLSLSITLSICFVFSILGNAVFIILLIPFKKIYQKICYKKDSKVRNSARLNTTRKYSSATPDFMLNQGKYSNVSNVYFIVTSLMDLFFSIVIIPFHIGTILENGFWIFGYNICKVQNFYGNLALCTTSLILITISVERYLAIVKNISKNKNKLMKCCIFSQQFKLKGALFLLFFYWILASGIAIPYLIYNLHLPVVKGVNCYWLTEEYMCVNLWLVGISSNIYKICYWLFMFLLPGVILFVCYGSISWSLFFRTNKRLGNSWRKRSKRHIIIILMCESFFYMICWFPFSIWSIHLSVNSLEKKVIKSTFENDIILFSQLYSITLVNVSLKWTFRLIALWPRIRVKFRFIRNLFPKNKISPTEFVDINPPFIINRSHNCEIRQYPTKNILVKPAVLSGSIMKKS